MLHLCCTGTARLVLSSGALLLHFFASGFAGTHGAGLICSLVRHLKKVQRSLLPAV